MNNRNHNQPQQVRLPVTPAPAPAPASTYFNVFIVEEYESNGKAGKRWTKIGAPSAPHATLHVCMPPFVGARYCRESSCFT
jgi:hypothetical protein